MCYRFYNTDMGVSLLTPNEDQFLRIQLFFGLDSTGWKPKLVFFLGSLTLGRDWQIDYTVSLDGKSSNEVKLKHHLQEKKTWTLSWRLCSACSWVGSVGVKLIHANSLKAKRKRTVMQPYRQNAEPASHAEFPVLLKIVESFC